METTFRQLNKTIGLYNNFINFVTKLTPAQATIQQLTILSMGESLIFNATLLESMPGVNETLAKNKTLLQLKTTVETGKDGVVPLIKKIQDAVKAKQSAKITESDLAPFRKAGELVIPVEVGGGNTTMILLIGVLIVGAFVLLRKR